jgi:hypothetical protein
MQDVRREEHLSVWEPAVGTKEVLPVVHVVARHRLVVRVGRSGRGVPWVYTR